MSSIYNFDEHFVSPDRRKTYERGNDGGIIVFETLDRSHTQLLDVYTPLVRTYKQKPPIGGPSSIPTALDYVHSADPVEQLGVCLTWRGMLLAEAKIILEIQRAFYLSLEAMLHGHIDQIWDYRPTSSYSLQPETDIKNSAVRELQNVDFSLTDLILSMVGMMRDEHCEALDLRSSGYLMELILLCLSWNDCLIDLNASGSLDTRVLTSTSQDHTSEAKITKIKVHQMQDIITFPLLDLVPREGQQIHILPRFRCGTAYGEALDSRCVIYSLEPHIPWLIWNESLSGFVGIVPFFSSLQTLEDELGESLFRHEGPFTVVKLLRIVIKAIITDYHSDSTLSLQRTIRTRLTLKVIPWYSYHCGEGRMDSDESVANPKDVPCPKPNVIGPSHSTLIQNARDCSWLSSHVSSLDLDELPQSTKPETSPNKSTSVPRKHAPWKRFESNDVNVASNFHYHQSSHKEEMQPESPRRHVDKSFGLGFPREINFEALMPNEPQDIRRREKKKSFVLPDSGLGIKCLRPHRALADPVTPTDGRGKLKDFERWQHAPVTPSKKVTKHLHPHSGEKPSHDGENASSVGGDAAVARLDFVQKPALLYQEIASDPTITKSEEFSLQKPQKFLVDEDLGPGDRVSQEHIKSRITFPQTWGSEDHANTYAGDAKSELLTSDEWGWTRSTASLTPKTWIQSGCQENVRMVSTDLSEESAVPYNFECYNRFTPLQGKTSTCSSKSSPAVGVSSVLVSSPFSDHPSHQKDESDETVRDLQMNQTEFNDTIRHSGSRPGLCSISESYLSSPNADSSKGQQHKGLPKIEPVLFQETCETHDRCQKPSETINFSSPPASDRDVRTSVSSNQSHSVDFVTDCDEVETRRRKEQASTWRSLGMGSSSAQCVPLDSVAR